MATFLRSVRKSDDQTRYYVNGCRVKRSTFEELGTGLKSCFNTVGTATHWKHYYEQRL